jgi:RND family efflux transporter MFP subunit
MAFVILTKALSNEILLVLGKFTMKKPLLKRTHIIVIGFVIILVSGSLWLYRSSPDESIMRPPYETKTLTVYEEDIFDLKPVSCAVDSVRKLKARSRINGTVASLSITEGDNVKQGDVLGIVTDPKIALEIEAIDARIKSMEQQRKQAEADYQRNETLRKNNVVSQAKFDEMTTNLKVLENNLDALRANRESQLKHQEEGQVIAGVSGKVLSVPITKGAVVMNGDIIAEIADEEFVLKLTIPESYSPFIKVDDEIDVDDNSKKDSKTIKAKVQKLYPQLEAGKIIADLKIDNLHNMYVGKLMTAFVKTKSHKGFLIPEKYILSKHGMKYVILKDVGEIVIQTGKKFGESVEILSGLNNNDALVMP